MASKQQARLKHWTVKACSTLAERPSEALVQVLTEEIFVMASLIMPSGLEGLLLLQLCAPHHTCAHMHTSMYTHYTCNRQAQITHMHSTHTLRDTHACTRDAHLDCHSHPLTPPLWTCASAGARMLKTRFPDSLSLKTRVLGVT